jgi:hypothetical protein
MPPCTSIRPHESKSLRIVPASRQRALLTGNFPTLVSKISKLIQTGQKHNKFHSFGLARYESKNPTGFHLLSFTVLLFHLLWALSDTSTCFGANPSGTQEAWSGFSSELSTTETLPLLNTKTCSFCEAENTINGLHKFLLAPFEPNPYSFRTDCLQVAGKTDVQW